MNNENTLKAISDAKSQGFIDEYRTSGSSSSMPHSDIFLSPAFWQALGKARGWITPEPDVWEPPLNLKVGFNEWHVKWSQFIDHLAEGKDAESFFASLEE